MAGARDERGGIAKSKSVRSGRKSRTNVILLTDSVYQKTEGPLEGRRELISNRLTLLSTPGRARCTIPDSQIPEDLWPRQHSPQ